MIVSRVSARPGWVQWTAVVAVGLTLAVSMRPAYAMTSAPAFPHRAPAGPATPAPAGAVGSGVATHVTHAARPGVRPRMRAQLAPARLHVVAPSAAGSLST